MIRRPARSTLFPYTTLFRSTGDRSGTDVHARTDLRVPQVSQVVCLRPLAQLDLLGLDKIPHVRALTDLAARTQVRVRSDHCALSDPRLFHDASRSDHDAVANLTIANHAIGAYSTRRSDARLPEQLHIGLDHRVSGNLHIRIDHAGRGTKHCHALRHQLTALRQTHLLVDVRQFGSRVPTQRSEERRVGKECRSRWSPYP